MSAAPQHVHDELKNTIKQLIIAPCIDTIIEKTGYETATKIIIQSKKSRLGRKELQQLHDGKYDPKLLDAATGISRIYEGEVNFDSILGKKVADNKKLLFSICDQIINDVLKPYCPETSYTISKEEATEKIRSLILKLSEHQSCKPIISQIIELKQKAGILPAESSRGFPHGINLSNLDLSGLDLSNLIELKSVSFNNSNLEGTKLRGASLCRCTFENCNLKNTDFRDCGLIGEEVSFKGSDVTDARFNGAKIEFINTWTKADNDSIADALAGRGAENTDKIRISFISCRMS